MNYLHWKEEIIRDFSEENISKKYENGFVFTRIGKGVMHQTRSVRINLEKFTASSENRRILKKVSSLTVNEVTLPLAAYDYTVGKLAKDFYAEKFGDGIMSAQKVKEMLTDQVKSNFNTLLTFGTAEKSTGFAICYKNAALLHYSYPFYDVNASPKDMGLGMMTLTIERAKQAGLKYVYLGSLQRPTDTYKLQFAGLEWFDGSQWRSDIEPVKALLAQNGGK